MRTTVIDVAREAGVSRTTVSNVFGERGKFSDATRDSVLAAAQKLGYRPNLAARALITNRSGLIGLILPPYIDTHTLADIPFYNIIMDSLYAVLRGEAFYDLLIYSTPSQDRHARISEHIDSRSVDGIIAIGEYDPDFLHELAARSIPVVLIDNYAHQVYPQFNAINSDDEAGGYLATQRLISRGYRAIAACLLELGSPLMQKRLDGYLRAMREAGYPTHVVDRAGSPFETGLRFADLLVERGLEAAFCTEDMVAVGVLHRLLQRGVQVGRDFGLVGFDNIHIAAQVHPELTTVDQRIYEKGETAARLLLDVLKENCPPGRRLVLPVELVVRGTA